MQPNSQNNGKYSKSDRQNSMHGMPQLEPFMVLPIHSYRLGNTTGCSGWELGMQGTMGREEPLIELAVWIQLIMARAHEKMHLGLQPQ